MIERNAVKFYDFVTGSVASNQLDATIRAIKLICEKANERFIGSMINRRGSYPDPELVSKRFGDCVGGGSRLKFDEQQEGARFDLNVGRRAHRENEFWPEDIAMTKVEFKAMKNNSTISEQRATLCILLGLLMGCKSAPVKSSERPEPMHRAATAAPVKAKGTPKDTLQEAADKPSAPFEGEDWHPMFDGKTLTGWRETDFAGRGEVQCESGLVVLNMGDPFTGINWTNDFPKMNFEVGLDAMRVGGSDFFCGLTVPVRDSFCSLIVGGWGGSLMGISSLDHMDASENETTRFVSFETGRWYRIRLRVTEKRIEAWIDKEKMINVDISDKTITLRPGDIEMSKPFGIACWQTTSALRQIKMRRVDGPEGPLKR